MGKPLVLGMAVGYEPEKVRLFVQSLESVGFAGKLALFVYAGDVTGFRMLLRKYAPRLDVDLAVVRSVRQQPKFIRSCLKRLAAMAPTERVRRHKARMLRYHGMPHLVRYFHYADFLSRNAGFSRVLISDVRDVVFQGDPFSGWSSGLHLGMESPALTIATEAFDREWILDAYGPGMLAQIGDRQVSCSGVTYGDAESIATYVTQIIEEALRFPFRKMRTRIYDQAFHNKLLHCGELRQVRLCQPLRSPIATLACLNAELFSLSPDGFLLNEDGRPATIVHQYDRHPVLVRAFEKRMPA